MYNLKIWCTKWINPASLKECTPLNSAYWLGNQILSLVTEISNVSPLGSIHPVYARVLALKWTIIKNTAVQTESILPIWKRTASEIVENEMGAEIDQ